MSEQPSDASNDPNAFGVDQGIDDDDQDSEPTMMAPDDRRPDGTVADLHDEDEPDGSGPGAG
jgi:hypothetical protein